MTDRHKTSLEDRRAIAERVRNGESQNALARELGIHRDTIRRFCAEFGVQAQPSTRIGPSEPQISEYSEEFKSIGPRPIDQLERVSWAAEYVAVSLEMVAHSKQWSDRERVKVIDKLANTINTLQMKERLLAAEDVVRGYQRKIKGEGSGPEMVKVDGARLGGKSYRAAPVRRKGG